MTGAAIIHSDRISVAPKADIRAAAAVPPVAAAPFSLPTLQGVASAPAGLSSAGSALSFGLADRSDCIGDIDPELEAAITALEVSWLRCGIVMNSMALRVAAASEIQPSVSTTSIPAT